MNDFELMDTLPGSRTSDADVPAAGFVRQPLRVRVTDPITVLATMFARSTAGIAVVLDDEDRPLGVVRPGALLRSVDQHGTNSLVGITMKDLMEPAIMLKEHTSLLELLRVFSERAHCEALVVDSKGRLLGELTAQDVLYLAGSLATLTIGALSRRPS